MSKMSELLLIILTITIPLMTLGQCAADIRIDKLQEAVRILEENNKENDE